MNRFQFSAGPWNIHTGADVFGPSVRESILFEDKIKKFKEIGLDYVQFHDDDVVPNLNELSDERIISEAKKVGAILNKYDLKAEFVAPRLWEDSRTIDGGYTSNSEKDREYAIWRTYRSIDIAKELGTEKIVLWLAREGTLVFESKNPVDGVNKLIEAINKMLEYDKKVKILIEPKPNEPIDRSFCPTQGHVMAIASRTNDPSRVGGLVESAHAVLSGLDPANEMAFSLSFGKLWSVHLNDQNGLKYDQDKTFGAENLRSAFNQIKVLVENNYGTNGEVIGLDVKAIRTQKIEDCYRHLQNSIEIVKILEKKVEQFDYEFQKQCITERNYEKLENYIIKLLMGVN